MSGRVESLLPGGEALVRSDRGVYLAINGVPGDRVELAFLPRQRGAARAAISRIVESSSLRIDPVCEVAGQCGGCALHFLEPFEHPRIKSAWVKDAFRRSIDSQTRIIETEKGELHGRRRLRWFRDVDQQGAFLGFREANSHRVVRHLSCQTATEALNALRAAIEESDVIESFESVQAVQLDDGIHLILEHGEGGDGFTPELQEIDGLPVQWWIRNGVSTRPVTSPAGQFHDFVPTEDGKEIAIRIGPDDFIQGDRQGNREMIRQVIEWCKGARLVADLFAGVGNLSLPIAAGGCRVVGAEFNGASVKAANANATRLQLDASYHQVNLFDTFDSEPFAGADVLILDPPRRGAKKVCSMMGRLLPAKIVMVNCDVASGGRDGETIRKLGYRLHSLRAIDLFPYTGHVEAMSLWVR